MKIIKNAFVFTIILLFSFTLMAKDKSKYIKKGAIMCGNEGKDSFVDHFDKQKKKKLKYDDLVDATKYFVDDIIQKGLCFFAEKDYKLTVLSKPYWHTGSLYRAFVNEFDKVLYVVGDFYEK